jgi:hypothetical protein
MIGPLLNEVRWEISPIKAPQDDATQDRMESGSMNVAADGVRASSAEPPRLAPHTIASGGDVGDPEGSTNAGFSIAAHEAEGRAAIGQATIRAS